MRVRRVSSGWLQAAFLAALAIIGFVAFRGAIARSSLAGQTFAYTFVGVTAVPMVSELRRRSRQPEGQPVRWLPVPDRATRDGRWSLRPLVWAVALVLWILIPLAALAAALNLAVGVMVHDVAGSLGGVLAAADGAMAGLAAWQALRTVLVWRVAAPLERWPAYVEAPALSLRPGRFLEEFRREPVYYYETPRSRRL
ncbi:MAG TPA: hypothetical protein VFW71_05715 [Actinomycetota bacterium]|nr:hypothetical protein [Actinomycetota bacterium]